MGEVRYSFPQITFKEFSKYIANIDKMQKFRNAVSDLFNDFEQESGEIAELYFPTLLCDLVEVLAIASGDNDTWIDYWVFELDCGREYEDGCVKDKEGNSIPLKTVEDLWNIIQKDYREFIVKRKSETVPVGVLDQIMWERDIAIEQLNSIGKSFGEKMDDIKEKLNDVISLQKEKYD